MPPLTLRMKLSASFLLILLPLLGLTFYTYHTESERWANSLLEDQMQTAQALAGLADANFDQAFIFARAVANDPLVHSMNPLELDPHLRQLQSDNPEYAGIAVYNSAGDLVGTSSPLENGVPPLRNAMNVPHLAQTLKTGKPTISPVFLQGEGAQAGAMVGVAVPVRDDAGKTIGVVSVPIPLKDLAQHLKRLALDPQQNILVIDPQGRVALAVNNPNLSWQQRDLRDFTPVQAAMHGQPSKVENLVSPLMGGPAIGAFIPSPKFGWIVGVTEQQDIALAPVWSEFRDWMLGLAAVALLSIMLIMFLSERLVQPIHRLALNAQALGRGDLTTKVEIKTGDELEELGHTFNQMADEIRSREAKLRQMHQELEQHATQLEMANQELESFTYSVSHDLRAPLAAIDQFSRLLQDDYGAALDPHAQSYLGLVRSGIQQMDDLITSLLALSRLGRQALKKQAVDMHALVAQSLDLVEQGTPRANRTVQAQEMPDAIADPVLLKQVWVNLIGNAFKFTRDCQDPHIEIGCQACDGADRVYYVRDNGVGFEMGQANKLFGVFQRLHSSEDYPGNGVGLAIVARIIHRHGGRVWAEGQVGRGATFYFTLGDV